MKIRPAHSGKTSATMANKTTTLTFWGVRGSTPTVDRATWRYGGNTPCLELVTPEGARFILDCGTGLRALGNRWAEMHAHSPVQAHIFVTHYHWDHIQGIPFFAPFYSDQNEFHFYSFRSEFLGRDSLKQVLEAQMAHPYFPVNLGAMTARRRFNEIRGGDHFEIKGTRITARWLNHPQGCLGFRFETSAGVLVYATDNEPGDAQLDRSLRELAAGADVFINDAQFSPEQLATTRRGWGHSTWLEGVKVAKDAGAGNLVLFHHDPDSSDAVVDALLREAREKFPAVWAAAEGMTMTLGDARLEVAIGGAYNGLRREAHFRARVTGLTEEGRAFQEETFVRGLTLHGAVLYLAHSPRLQSELQVTMDAPGYSADAGSPVNLRGYVVRREPGPEKDQIAVGILFTE